MKEEMKKHPIDDLFRDKLSGLERKPSEGAWERIQEGQKKNERRLGAWIWYVAASVLLALLTGYSVWINEAKKSEPETAVVTKPKSVVRPAGKQPADIAKTEEKQLVVLEKPVNETKSGKIKSVTSVKNLGPVEKIEIVEKPATSQEQIAVTKPVIKDSELTLPTPVSQIEATGIAQNQPIVAAVEKNENRIIIVKIDSPEENQDKRKSSRFSKIFRQLKNVKEGESVNWEDVGFNPKTVVARVDDRLRHGEEKVSEKYQDLKERSKL